MTDPIADMLTRIRNALTAKHETVEMPGSNMKNCIILYISSASDRDLFRIAPDRSMIPYY